MRTKLIEMLDQGLLWSDGSLRGPVETVLAPLVGLEIKSVDDRDTDGLFIGFVDGDNIDPLRYCPVDVTRYSERDKTTTDFVAEFIHAECDSQTTFSEYTRERFCEAVKASKKAHPVIWGTRLKTMRDFAEAWNAALEDRVVLETWT